MHAQHHPQSPSQKHLLTQVGQSGLVAASFQGPGAVGGVHNLEEVEHVAQPVLALSDVANGSSCEVVEVLARANQFDWTRRLAEIGFIPGERLRILARGLPGADPLAVRIGTSTFALRKAEAACVRVRVLFSASEASEMGQASVPSASPKLF